MTLIKSKISSNYKENLAKIIHDPYFDSRYLGVFIRLMQLITQGEEKQIDLTKMSILYPANGRDFYRSALKYLCKIGYLIRIPQNRKQGRFQTVEMQLFDTKQLEKPLSNGEVEILFSKDVPEEIVRKIYPRSI